MCHVTSLKKCIVMQVHLLPYVENSNYRWLNTSTQNLLKNDIILGQDNMTNQKRVSHVI